MPATTIRLRDKDIIKLSVVINVPEETLFYLEYRGLLDSNECRDELILFDYRKLKALQQPRLKPGRIVQILMDEYNLSKAKIEFVIYSKKEKQYFCSECGVRISKDEYTKNAEKCNKCVQKMIDKTLELDN